MRDRSVVKSSVIPSARYSWPGSLLRLLNGSTTIDSRGALPAGEPDAAFEAAGLVLSGGPGWPPNHKPVTAMVITTATKAATSSGRRGRGGGAAGGRGAGNPAIASRPSAKVRTGRAML